MSLFLGVILKFFQLVQSPTNLGVERAPVGVVIYSENNAKRREYDRHDTNYSTNVPFDYIDTGLKVFMYCINLFLKNI